MGSYEEMDRRPPHTPSLRGFEQHLNDLKKENFSLKLRIYFLEEKIQQKFAESSDDVHKKNIELKVEVQSLKKQLEEKLDEALCSCRERQTECSRSAAALGQQVEALEVRGHFSSVQKEEVGVKCDGAVDECDEELPSDVRQRASRNQVPGTETGGAQTDVLSLQTRLFQTQLELQDAERLRQQLLRTQEDLRTRLQCVDKDLQEALQHRSDTERHNQELLLALEEARAAARQRHELLSSSERARQKDAEQRETTIRELKNSLHNKEQLVEDYDQLFDKLKENRDFVLQKLREHVKDRDRALEQALDEKFRCVEEKEVELQRLQLLLHEKDGELERQRCVLANNDETITNLELLLQGRTVALQQLSDACGNVQRQQQEGEEWRSSILSERDAIIGQLQVALHARTQETQDLRCSLFAQTPPEPRDVVEELKVNLQLKDQLFQEVLADRTRQARQHQQQVEDLLRTISARDQYIKDSACRLGSVLTAQSTRLQELRRQLSLGSWPKADCGLELQVVKEELRLVLKREKEAEELSRNQEVQLDSLARLLFVKDELIRDLQSQMVEPASLPLIHHLTQEVQEVREILVMKDCPPARGPFPDPDQPSSTQSEFVALHADDLRSEFTESVDEQLMTENLHRHTDETAADVASEPGSGGGAPPPPLPLHSSCLKLLDVNQLLRQKEAVERQLGALKVQLEKAGVSSLSQMRTVVLNLRDQDLKRQREEIPLDVTSEDKELDVTIVDEDMWDNWDEEQLSLSEGMYVQRCDGQQQADGCHLSADQRHQDMVAVEKAVRLQRQSEALEERLMVSDATVQAQAEQLRDFRDLLSETVVRQDSKQVQVDLQDLGYETCGRSENEAERDDASSPEFDDLEMCTSLDCGSLWWPDLSTSTHGDEAPSLQHLVEDLRSQLSRSQGVIRGLRSRLRSLSTNSGCGPSMPQMVDCSAADDDSWRSSDGDVPAPPSSQPDKGLQDLVSRVDALEDQMRKGRRRSAAENRQSSTWAGRFDVLIQAQARELSHLRQRLREASGVCHVLMQQLDDATKTFEQLLSSNDIDYDMSQSFRQQLVQSTGLARRVSAKIREPPEEPLEEPEEQTELLAIRLTQQLQQKDRLIEALEAKLKQPHHRLHRSDTSCGSHTLSDATDQWDRISYVSDGQDSAHEDLELHSVATTEPSQDEKGRVSADCVSLGGTMSPISSVCASISSHRTPEVTAAHEQSHTGFSDSRTKPSVLLTAHQQPDPASFRPSHFHGYQPPPDSSHLDAMRGGASLLESSALWDTRNRTPDLSSGSSGYQSGSSHTGSALMKENLREIRSLRERLETSIQTNERLRRQLEAGLPHSAAETSAPTNIYIHSLDSGRQLSSEIQLLKDENVHLQARLKRAVQEAAKEAEQLREVALLDRARLKEAELQTERWAEQSRQLQADVEAQRREVDRLRQERQSSQEAVNRLQHEVNVLQQQLCENRRQLVSLQSERHTDKVPSPPLKDSSLTFTRHPAERHETEMTADEEALTLQGHAPDGSYANHNGRHVVSHIDDYKALQQKISIGSGVLSAMEDSLCSLNASQLSDVASARKLLVNVKTLQCVLEEAESLLQMFWRAALPVSDGSKVVSSLRDEVAMLRLKLSKQEEALRDATETVKSSNHTKDCIEHFIVSQLSRTRDVLRKARTNLQENQLRISSLPCASTISTHTHIHTPTHVKVKTQEVAVNSLLVHVS